MKGHLNFSKSKYCGLWQCPKIAWLQKRKPEQWTPDDSLAQRMQAGDEIGDLAKGLFGSYVDVTIHDGMGPDLAQMVCRTSEEMAKQTPVICEASFSWQGLYCAVDILRRNGSGWAIYEVKSSTHPEKEIYLADVAYQAYVLGRCGIRVTGIYLVTLNNEYVFDGTLRVGELFRTTDVTKAAMEQLPQVDENIAMARDFLSNETEPNLPLSERCRVPYKCGFWNYCAHDLPVPSVFDLYRTAFGKKLDYYKRGLISYADLRFEPSITKHIHRMQIDHALTEQEDEIDRESIRGFLSNLSYPLYFLDFETVQPVIPRYLGTKPYAQIPFQYSLHFIEQEGGELHHKEFLAEPGTDPRRPLAEQLCQDIPMGVCVTAYNKAFECTRIKELAETFPDLAKHLLDIRDHIVDLLVPFQSGWYYNRAMGGSFSIKSVLPALFPDDPALNYHNLEEIHHGGEAMAAFPAMEYMDPQQRERTRKNLLKYCELDTYAMVKLWEKLCVAGEV